MADRANQQEYNYEAETFEQALVMAVTDISNVRHRSRSLMGQYEHASPTACAVVSSSVLTSSSLNTAYGRVNLSPPARYPAPRSA
jgi:hypothetical protein